MAKDPAYPMYAQDFDMDTADWGIDEIGVYIRNTSIVNNEFDDVLPSANVSFPASQRADTVYNNP